MTFIKKWFKLLKNKISVTLISYFSWYCMDVDDSRSFLEYPFHPFSHFSLFFSALCKLLLLCCSIAEREKEKHNVEWGYKGVRLERGVGDIKWEGCAALEQIVMAFEYESTMSLRSYALWQQ